jgi:ribosomal protein S27AE
LGYGHTPITKPGDRVRISVPQRHPEIDRLIIGYVDRTVGLCSECGAPFAARRSDALTCGRSACRMQRMRRKP